MVGFHACRLQVVARFARTFVFIQFARCLMELALSGQLIHSRFFEIPNGGGGGDLLRLSDQIRTGQKIQVQRFASVMVIARVGQLKPASTVVLHFAMGLNCTPRRLIVVTRYGERRIVESRDRWDLLPCLEQYSTSVRRPSVSWTTWERKIAASSLFSGCHFI